MKRFLAFALTAITLISSLPITASENVFRDVNQGDWYYETVTEMTEMGLFKGKGNNMFCPGDTMTRAEFVTVVMRALYPDADLSSEAGEKWWQDAYEAALEKGILKNPEFITYNRVDLDIAIQRQEMALISVRALNVLGETDITPYKHIPDISSVNKSYADYVKKAYGAGIIIGDEKGYFKPTNTLTRAEASTVLYRIIEKSARANKQTLNKFGSASYIDDKTLIVSIFASDNESSWDFSDKNQNALATQMMNDLSVATSWLTKEVKKYGANAEFIYDWAKNPDLVYSVRFYETLVRADGGAYYDQVEYINKHINTEELLRKHNAQNIIYVFFFNTPFSNPHNSWSINKKTSDNFNTEIINIYYRFDNDFVVNPCIYAHELMHCFGAKDLYYKSSYITQDYVDYLSRTESDDIMFSVHTGNKIHSIFSPLDAYYIGLSESCPEIEKWNLAKSDYEILK